MHLFHKAFKKRFGNSSKLPELHQSYIFAIFSGERWQFVKIISFFMPNSLNSLGPKIRLVELASPRRSTRPNPYGKNFFVSIFYQGGSHRLSLYAKKFIHLCKFRYHFKRFFLKKKSTASTFLVTVQHRRNFTR